MVRQRTTVQFKSLNAIDTDNLLLNEEHIKIPGRLFKSRQDRLTFNKEELPQDIQTLLDDIYMLRLQWSSPDSIRDELFQNFEVDGVSVNLVPSQAQYEPIFDKFGEFTKNNFNVQFNHTNLVSTPTSASFHSNQVLKSSVIDRFLRKLVPEGLDRISFLTNFELNFEDNKLSVQWISSPYDLLISKSANIRKEVAIIQTKDFHNDLELSGIRMVLDETDALAPSKTLLFVKNRHHLLENKLSFEFNEPIGLHPTLKISNLSNISQSSPHSSCELFIYNTISQELFFDKYQYDTTSLTLLNSWGEHDLEAPIWKVSQFGSIQLFQVNTDQLTEKNEVEIKFHSRYLNPSQSNQFNAITPNVFWACDSRQFIDDFEEIRNNPFDSFGLGYESLFEDDTVFCHMEKDRRVLEYTIPRGDKKDFNSIQYITLGSVVIGVLYILFKITKAFIRANGTKKTISEEKKKK